jgi:hypothetical protein
MDKDNTDDIRSLKRKLYKLKNKRQLKILTNALDLMLDNNTITHEQALRTAMQLDGGGDSFPFG